MHKASITACVRTAGEGGEPYQQMLGSSPPPPEGFYNCGTGSPLSELRWWAWRPQAYYILEDDFECWLLNARHLKNVPGRKTDVKDAEWICRLVEHGLVRPSFVPPKER